MDSRYTDLHCHGRGASAACARLVCTCQSSSVHVDGAASRLKGFSFVCVDVQVAEVARLGRLCNGGKAAARQGAALSGREHEEAIRNEVEQAVKAKQAAAEAQQQAVQAEQAAASAAAELLREEEAEAASAAQRSQQQAAKKAAKKARQKLRSQVQGHSHLL